VYLVAARRERADAVAAVTFGHRCAGQAGVGVSDRQRDARKRAALRIANRSGDRATGRLRATDRRRTENRVEYSGNERSLTIHDVSHS
jgi:hypothetical protein